MQITKPFQKSGCQFRLGAKGTQTIPRKITGRVQWLGIWWLGEVSEPPLSVTSVLLLQGLNPQISGCLYRWFASPGEGAFPLPRVSKAIHYPCRTLL